MLPPQTLDSLILANANVCFLIGVALNLLLIWLILKRSPEELRTYSRVLLQVAAVNLVFLTFTVLVAPVQLSGNQGAITYGVGWLMRVNDGGAGTRAWNFALAAVWCYLVYVMQFSIAVPFIFRYFVVCRGVGLSGSAYGALFGLVLTASFFCIPFFIGLGVSLGVSGI